MLRSPLLTALALTSVLVVPSLVLQSPAAAQPQQTLTATPQQGDRGVRESRPLSFAGTAPDDSPVANVVALSYADVDGTQELETQEFNSIIYTSDAGPEEFVRKDGRTVTGRVGLGCAFAPAVPLPGSTCATKPADPVSARVQVTLRSGAVLTSQLVPVDVVFPTILPAGDPRPAVRGYQVVAPDTIRVSFSEPVRHDRGDSPTDWTITEPDALVLEVVEPADAPCARPPADPRLGNDRCVRLLRTTPLPEDAQPRVEYEAGPDRLDAVYEDLTGNGFDRSDRTGSGAREQARDAVRPAAPTVRRVAGRAPEPSTGRVASNATAFDVELSGLTPQHRAFVRVSGVDRSFTVGPAPVRDDGTATVRVEGLVTQGVYRLEAEARDRNDLSSVDDRALVPAHADGQPSAVEYALDTDAPDLESAVSRTGGVLVSFDEAVRGTDRASDWTVDDGRVQVTAVTGSGATRTLSTSSPAPRDAGVVYAASGDYADEAGTPVANRLASVDGLSLPTVTSPSGLTYLSAASTTIRGTADAGRLVEVFADSGNDGTPDGVRVAQQQLAAGETQYAIEVPLPQDGPHDLVVRAREDRDGGAVGPAADVPRLVRDTVRPRLSVERPAEGQALPGDTDTEVAFSLNEANPGPGPVRLEYSADGGATYATVVDGTSGTSFTWRTPAVSSEAAVLRLTATDLAGNTLAEPVLRRFVVDALPPVLSARTADARTVVVRLSERVTGSSSALDWLVKGERTSSASQTEEDGVPVVRLTTGPGVTIGPDEEPSVEYRPTLSDQYRDRAGQGVLRRSTTAVDGILPAVPSVLTPAQPVLTRESTQRVSGSATLGDTVELLDATGRRVAGPLRTAADGTWEIELPLARDGVSDLRARGLDRNGNRSASATPVPRIEQDGADPVVTLDEPRAGTRVDPGQRVTVRWTSSDRNLVDGATVVEQSTDGGETFTTLAEQQPASGSLVWTVPGTVTPRALLRVSTPDRAGRTGRGTSGLLGIGTAAGASPGASPSGTASPVPPLQVQVPGTSIAPGELAEVTVRGEPGARVELRAYSRPETRYRQVRTATLDGTGRTVLQIRPGTNTRLYARRLTEPKGADSGSRVVEVRTALSLTVVRNGRRDYTFQGRVLPRRPGQLVTLYRVIPDGRRVITAQVRTDSTGTYRVRRVFTGSGRFRFLTRTGQDVENAAGESDGGRARPTAVF